MKKGFSPICEADGRKIYDIPEKHREMEKQLAENKMGVMPVGKLLMNMAGPMIISMLVQALYNVVDSMFVARVNEDALAALSLAFPVQMLMVAIGIGTGVGTNALLSKSIGQGDNKKASRIAGNAIFLALVIYIIFLLFGLFGINFYVSTQTTNPEIKEMVDAVNLLVTC